MRGEAYGFHADVLHIRMPVSGRLVWELVLVSEIWRRGDAETMHATKWLKLLAGKPNDLLKWIGANRDGTAYPDEKPSLSRVALERANLNRNFNGNRREATGIV